MTGLGVVSPIGTGKEQFWKSVVEGASGIRKITKIPSLTEYYGGEIRGFDVDKYVDDRRFRRAADISKYALAAIKLAIMDTAIEVADNTSLVMGITHGALNYTQEYHWGLLKESAEVSPMLFSDSVLNAPAGNASICFGINGPVHTIIGGAEASIKAIMLERQLLEKGIAEKSIVVSTEEINELAFSCYLRKGMNQLSEGSCAIVIEKEDDVKSQPYCYIAGISSLFNPASPDTALTDAINQCLQKAGLKIKDIDIVITDSRLPDTLLNNIPIGSIISLTGNAFSVTSLCHVVLSAIIIKTGVLPNAIIKNKTFMSDNIKNVMVCASDREGIVFAIILTSYN